MIDRRAVAIAGHTGDVETARRGLAHDDGDVRSAALGALQRLGALDDATVTAAFADPDPAVRRRAARSPPGTSASICRSRSPTCDPSVVEVAAWACGEHEVVSDDILGTLVGLAGGAAGGREPLVREAAVAALGALGDERGLDAILAATSDKPAIRRRAVLALAPFVAPDHPAPPRSRRPSSGRLTDRDWQVRQAAEDLTAVDDPPEP